MKITKAYRKRVSDAFKARGANVELSILAAHMGTTVEVMRKIVTGNCVVSAKRAVYIQSVFGVPAEIMRPDIFGKGATF